MKLEKLISPGTNATIELKPLKHDMLFKKRSSGSTHVNSLIFCPVPKVIESKVL